MKERPRFPKEKKAKTASTLERKASGEFEMAFHDAEIDFGEKAIASQGDANLAMKRGKAELLLVHGRRRQ